ncbi:hypothetical protein HMPREF9609_01057 [Cutibacterium acnes HL027PA1]|nr:hypothetical protein HMPREF9609_01057 [Cutibacterium acnes HL027PA1]
METISQLGVWSWKVVKIRVGTRDCRKARASLLSHPYRGNRRVCFDWH